MLSYNSIEKPETGINKNDSPPPLARPAPYRAVWAAVVNLKLFDEKNEDLLSLWALLQRERVKGGITT